MGLLILQAVVVTDPTLAYELLRCKVLDKFRFQYSFLDPVSGQFFGSPNFYEVNHRSPATEAVVKIPCKELAIIHALLTDILKKWFCAVSGWAQSSYRKHQ